MSITLVLLFMFVAFCFGAATERTLIEKNEQKSKSDDNKSEENNSVGQ